jgi:hypothetical protein
MEFWNLRYSYSKGAVSAFRIAVHPKILEMD